MGVEEFRAALREAFPKLSQEDFASAKGDREKLAEILAEKSGKPKEDALNKINEIYERTQ